MSYVMGIESTAHTFGVGIIDENFRILADIRYVYKPTYIKGIDPHEAAEHHSKVAAEAVEKALDKAGISIYDLSAISYSYGPGLGPCLRIGASLSRFLSSYYNIPLYPVHHGLGHIELASQLLNVDDPVVILVSGGHTSILGFSEGRWRVYGETLDITLGNLLDSFAREAGIPFPGGPRIEEIAKKGKKYINMPYTVKGNNIMYSGLLTFAVDLIGKYPLEDICYSLQETAFSALVEASERALVQLKKKNLIIAGGVAPNNRLYEMMKVMCENHSVKIYRLDNKYNPDNGVQIAIVGLLYYKQKYPSTSPPKAIIKQRVRIEEEDVPWRV